MVPTVMGFREVMKASQGHPAAQDARNRGFWAKTEGWPGTEPILTHFPSLCMGASKPCFLRCGLWASIILVTWNLAENQNCCFIQNYRIRICTLAKCPGKAHLVWEIAAVDASAGLEEPGRAVSRSDTLLKDQIPLSNLAANTSDCPAQGTHSIPTDPGNRIAWDHVSVLNLPIGRSTPTDVWASDGNLLAGWKASYFPATKGDFSSPSPWIKKASRMANYLIGNKVLSPTRPFSSDNKAICLAFYPSLVVTSWLTQVFTKRESCTKPASSRV